MSKINKIILTIFIVFSTLTFYIPTQTSIYAVSSISSFPSETVNTFVGDSRTARGFTWYTTGSETGTYIQIIATLKFKGFPDTSAKTIKGTYTKKSTSAGTRISHKVKVTGLLPGTSYTYRVGNGKDKWSSSSAIRTDSKTPAKFTFIHVTDSQGDSLSNYNLWENTILAALKKYPSLRFIAHTGDAVDYGTTEEQWEYFLNSGQDFLKKIPLAPTIGNHEMFNGGNVNFKSHFYLPTKSETGCNVEGVYSFDYGYAHFAVLNTQADSAGLAAQSAWLKTDMAKTKKPWKIILLHRGLYGSIYNTTDIRNAWLKTFDDAGVNVVLQGHDHSYVRTYRMRNGTNIKNGCVYITSGSSGIKFYGTVKRSWQKVNIKLKKQIYTALTVSGTSISINAYNKDNILLDSTTIIK